MVLGNDFTINLRLNFDLFAFCSVDNFTVEAEDVGNIRGVEIRNDESGWHLDKVRDKKHDNLKGQC